MKKIAVILTALFCACSALVHPDKEKAKAVVEALIQKENNGDYASTSQYYTDGFNKSEPIETRTAKLQQLHDGLGDFKSMELIKASDTTDANDFPAVDLIYRVKHTKLNSIEEFTVITEEGNLRVEEHSVVKE
jgi:hypothetical protein